MKLTNIIIVLYLFFSAVIFITFFENIFVWSSFFMNWVFLTIIFIYHLKIEKDYSPFISAYITFNFLFFLLAPMIQIKGFTQTENIFPNYFPYSEANVFYANLVILLFHCVFFFSYLFLKKRYLNKLIIKDYKQSYYITINILILLGIGVIVLTFSFDYLMNMIEESDWITKKRYNISVSSQLILTKVLYMIPFGAIILSHSYLKYKKKITNNTIIIFISLLLLLLLFIVLKNPLTEKRNAIGPMYITLLFLFIPKLLNTNIKSFVFLFFSLVILFPLISGLTHLDASFDEIVNNPSLIIERYNRESITTAFESLHYDAFANVMATIDYVYKNGMSFGYQFLSGLLFFVPRSIWESKPYSTGEVIGDYVIADYGFSYNNLSNPLVSEGYINFGLLGVIFTAIFLSFFIVKFMGWIKSNDPLKKVMAFYFAVHLLFLLRGDFTNGFSYFIGIFIGVLVIPKLLDYFLRHALKKNKTIR